MAIPLLIPAVLKGAALLGIGGLVGVSTSNTLGDALKIVAVVVGLFLIVVLMQKFHLLGGL